MAKQRFHRTRMMQATRLLPLAGLALVLGASTILGGQQPSKTSQPSAKTTQTTGQKSTRPTPAKSAKTPTRHKASAVSAESSMSAAGKRDPFKLPEVASGGRGGAEIISGAPGGVLPPGVRGLLISQLKLEGTVRELTAKKMIAVVTNETKRAYFLTENESVYNGVVSKITPDSVYFKENVLDADGRVTTREVVKRLNPAPGEGR